MKKTIVATVMVITSLKVFAQGLKPIFENTMKKIVEAKALVTYPKNTFLENIVKGNDGNLYVTNYPEGSINKISFEGNNEVYAKVAGKIAGIATYKTNEFLVTGWDKTGKPVVFLVAADKSTSVFATIEGGMFPNGIIQLGHDKFLIADSYAGSIWLLDAAKKTTAVWLKNELLARSSEKAEIPAANGLKLYKGNLYVSNSERLILLKIPVTNNKPGKPEVYLSNVFIDDFQFDSKGNIYAAANIYNYVLKITPSKTVEIIAGLQQGVAGPTSVYISKDKMGKDVLYVPTCGGMGVPPPTGVEEGKVVMIFPK